MKSLMYLQILQIKFSGASRLDSIKKLSEPMLEYC